MKVCYSMVDLGIKKLVFLMFSNMQQYLTLVENAHTEFKPERLEFLAKNIFGCSLLQRPSINLLNCHKNNV
jgi:hypothetical protein